MAGRSPRARGAWRKRSKAFSKTATRHMSEIEQWGLDGPAAKDNEVAWGRNAPAPFANQADGAI